MISEQASGPKRERRAVAVRGLVQGVGFRPFVYSLAHRLGLAGWVRNDVDGVQLEVEGLPEMVEAFLRQLREAPPPLAAVETVTWRRVAAVGESGFRIAPSEAGAEPRALVTPDAAPCDACLRELFDPGNRRHRYPFINCTACGPRFTIIRGVPYDRPLTTMASFSMCAACLDEYHDPADRRFHAQPNACPECGPKVRLVDRSGAEMPACPDPIEGAATLLRGGAVLAIKGLGGYHLACDPFSAAAVSVLRRRKARQDRPFALMARDLEQAREFCHVSPAEAALLEHPARPIVLLERRAAGAGGREVDEGVAPRQATLGVMLAYTPLHHLLLEATGAPLVMTSGNHSDEPIAYLDAEALAQLGEIADAFLTHDRPIHMRCDDSVVQPSESREGGGAGASGEPVLVHAPMFIRRSRGYAPAPVRLGEGLSRPLLAVGGDLKAAFCLGRERHAFLSHHLGDLVNYEAFRSYGEAVEHYRSLFDLQPEAIACDLHPEYRSTCFARDLADTGVPITAVQHHHAHVASCLADNERPAEERVIGVAFDGTGFGTDGAIWGGEFFTGSVQEGFARRAHLEYVPLPGGEAAIRHPWRMAAAYLIQTYGEEEMLRLPLDMLGDPLRASGRTLRTLSRMMERGVNSPRTSSAGRLFDAVAALLNLPGTERVTYEGQAAVELELAAAGHAAAPGYPMALRSQGEGLVLETRGLVTGIVDDLRAGRTPAEISGRFHASLAGAIAECCCRLRQSEGLTAVALSGGTFQNRLLLQLATDQLTTQGFTLYRHRRVPANDGGLALGQLVLADWAFRRGELAV